MLLSSCAAAGGLKGLTHVEVFTFQVSLQDRDRCFEICWSSLSRFPKASRGLDDLPFVSLREISSCFLEMGAGL